MNSKRIAVTSYICFFLSASLLLSGCGLGTILPITGVWKANTEFGSVNFTVNPDSTMITDAVFNFSDFQCGPGSQSGSIKVSYNNGLKITNGKINIELTNDVSMPVPPDPFNPVPPSIDTQIITLNGQFASDGKSASGTWIGTYNGSTCSQGKWDAVPGK